MSPVAKKWLLLLLVLVLILGTTLIRAAEAIRGLEFIQCV